ncbi:MAG: HP0268 family nuclease, partial [Arcobacteraceae bacterium]|nr:HP0268 family nuclease [Arcobacteraceae bacterium]
MEILIARTDINEKPKKVKLDKLKESGEKIFYFDKENSHKDMMAVVESFEKDGFNTHFREVKYGLSDG